MKKQLFLFLLSSILSFQLSATHIIGGEIGYKNMGGLVYEITLTIYGDCAGSSFPSLPTAIPEIEVFKNGVQFFVFDLSLTAPGVEVTPVCASEVNNTACVNTSATLPGIKRFIFKGDVLLDGPAANWSFLFNSNFGGMSGAGRSNAITNVLSGSRLSLLATLNNTMGTNNSSIFTTIPTPFFCINKPQEYNQGAADPDGDQLSFSLVPGLDQSLTTTVSYIPPYTYFSPLGTVPSGFNFNTTSGQMSFTPNIVQSSLVVNKVTETRAGIIVGTTMREMNLIVLSNCANQPSAPLGVPISSVGAFDPITNTIKLCNENLNPLFTLSVSDPDNQNVTASVTGLPFGSTASYVNNGTPIVQIIIAWTIPQPFIPGTYTFFVNLEDDGCPLISRQTYAYTVELIQPISAPTIFISPESCIPGSDGSILVNATSTLGSVRYSIGDTTFQSSGTFTGLTAGVYTVVIKDAYQCSLAETVTITAPSRPVITASTTDESCEPGNDGSIISNAISTGGSIDSYSLNGGTAQNSGVFTNLSAGTYTVIVTDISGCSATSLVIINAPTVPEITSTQANDITCNGAGDGSITLSVSPSNTYTFTLFPNNTTNVSGTFIDLEKGNYLIIVTNDKNCKDSTFATINEPDIIAITAIDISKATCDKNNAIIKITTNRTSTITYTLFPALSVNNSGVFINIAPGIYTVSVRDSNACATDSIFQVDAEPNIFASNIIHTDLPCNGWGTEGMAEVFPTGGVAPYTYLWTANPSYSDADKRIEQLFYGYYFVTITDATGCVTKDTVYINPGNCCENISIPNAFTPDANGNNDEWRLLTSSGLVVEQFAVYNRWGEKIWSAYDQRARWNGKRNGVDVSAGTYFYILQYKCLTDGKNYLKKGEVNVLR